jgi:hypothetical protein
LRDHAVKNIRRVWIKKNEVFHLYPGDKPIAFDWEGGGRRWLDVAFMMLKHPIRQIHELGVTYGQRTLERAGLFHGRSPSVFTF